MKKSKIIVTVFILSVLLLTSSSIPVMAFTTASPWSNLIQWDTVNKCPRCKSDIPSTLYDVTDKSQTRLAHMHERCCVECGHLDGAHKKQITVFGIITSKACSNSSWYPVAQEPFYVMNWSGTAKINITNAVSSNLFLELKISGHWYEVCNFASGGSVSKGTITRTFRGGGGIPYNAVIEDMRLRFDAGAGRGTSFSSFSLNVQDGSGTLVNRTWNSFRCGNKNLVNPALGIGTKRMEGYFSFAQLPGLWVEL